MTGDALSITCPLRLRHCDVDSPLVLEFERERYSSKSRRGDPTEEREFGKPGRERAAPLLEVE